MKRIELKKLLLMAAFVVLAAADVAKAQSGLVPLYTERLNPGTIGQFQNMKGRGIPGYSQPIKMVLPEGAKIAPVIGDAFADDQPAPQTYGCLIGAVYRFRVTQIPFRPGAELFPSVEVIDRTYPPAGMELQFPIPIHITQEELQYALQGKFVTRVIYLENPRTAIPNAYEPGFQPWFEVEPGTDPVVTADSLGRPVAILRLGSRRPTAEDMPGEFTYQSPPIQLFGNPPPAPAGGVEIPLGPGPMAGVPVHALAPKAPPRTEFHQREENVRRNTAPWPMQPQYMAQPGYPTQR
ncbi:hypothetical protein Pan97_17150 [Bremerella volcania]|uniref:Uncharacterized protein n=1 Tax=Bremerella volcania TaxID=2527984 RepID=A0A518C665_9BACT|nr:hypothetical protein [Bremerella volcania]QDU74702.1 hypothetical protein Pan97_17150 [Bremerella volcania]